MDQLLGPIFILSTIASAFLAAEFRNALDADSEELRLYKAVLVLAISVWGLIAYCMSTLPAEGPMLLLPSAFMITFTAMIAACPSEESKTFLKR